VTDLFATGRIVDLILVLVAAEAAFLVWYHRRTGKGVSPRDLLPNLISGACLFLALRGALVGAGWPVIGACLAAALAAHLTDLVLRWRR